MTSPENRASAEPEELAARFVPPRRRRRPLLAVGVMTGAVVVALIVLMARGPDAERTAQDVVESTLAGLPDGALASSDVRAAADGLRRALGLYPASDPALEATGVLHRRVAEQVEQDALGGTLERAAEVLEEAAVQWPDARVFADGGPLRRVLDGALERRRVSREVENLLAAVEERLAEDAPETVAVREALDTLRRALAIDPDNARARAVRNGIRRDVVTAARAALRSGETEQAGRLLEAVTADGRGDPELLRLEEEIERQVAARAQGVEIRRLLELAERRLAEDRLTSPAGDNAIAHFRAVLALDPDHGAARQGVERVAARYGVLVRDAIEDGALRRAERLLGSLAAVAPSHPELARLRGQLAAARRVAANGAADVADPARPDASAAAASGLQEQALEPMPTDAEGRLWFEVRASCVDAELRRYIEAYPAGRYIEEAWRRISSCIEER